MSLDYSRLCLYLLNWRGICGPTVGHATRQQQTTAENSCVVKQLSQSQTFQAGLKRKVQITSRLIEAATNIFLELKIFFISASHSLK